MGMQILGTGYYLPKKVVTNEDLTQWMETSDEWIRQRSGIEERRWVEPHESGTSISVSAAEMALKNAGLDIDQVDGLVHATLSPDHFFPGTAAIVQGALGMKQKPHFDVRNQCSGFLYALGVAYGLVESGQAETLLVIASEVQSRGLDLSTRGRGTAVLFGDGAGAVIVKKSANSQGLQSICLHSDGSFADKLWCEKPGVAAKPFLPEEEDSPSRYPQMEGQLVFKNAVSRMPEVLMEALKKAGRDLGDVQHFLFHQANLRINEFVAKTLKIPSEKIPNNIQKYGNCSSASIPMLLAENVENGRIKKGDLVTMTAFGSGFTWGSCVFQM
jgi:3-oxoacyl-[acyl-carrier-protein] synthase-3